MTNHWIMVSLYTTNKRVDKYRGQVLGKIIATHGSNTLRYLSIQLVNLYTTLQTYETDREKGRNLIGYHTGMMDERIRHIKDKIRELEHYSRILQTK